ncbi:MAG: SpoIIE family protein phosphatase [Planctomycetaceae bacterium]
MTDTLRVLLIDDDEDSAPLTRGMLARVAGASFDLEWAPEFDTGLDRLLSNEHDVCLLDYRLGARDGLQLLRAAVSKGCRVPMILVTGQSDATVDQQALQAGATDYLSKAELNGSNLARSIRFAIDRSRGEEQRRAAVSELSALVQHVAAGIWYLDANHRIRSIIGQCPLGNGAFNEQAVGRPFAEVIPQSYELVTAHRDALHGESKTLDFTADRRTFHIRIEPYRDAQNVILGSIGVAIDVTSHRYLESGLNDARKIQQRLFPSSAPVIEGFDLAGYCRPADAVGGDYYDFLTLSDGSLGVVIADVSRHGFPSALIMSSLRRAIRTFAATTSVPGEILEAANTVIYEDTPDEWFVTGVLASIDTTHRSLTLSGAGHEAYLFDVDGSVTRLSANGLPLGMIEQNVLATSGPISLRSGQLLLLTTDGIHEHHSDDGPLFGLPQVWDIVASLQKEPASEILDGLFHAALSYEGGFEPADDMTAVVVKVK